MNQLVDRLLDFILSIVLVTLLISFGIMRNIAPAVASWFERITATSTTTTSNFHGWSTRN